MKDTRFLMLNDNWAIATDSLQWIIQRYQPPKWRGVSFIAQCKAVLERNLRYAGVRARPEGKRALDALPATFKEWKAELRKLGEDWEPLLAEKLKETAYPGDPGLPEGFESTLIIVGEDSPAPSHEEEKEAAHA